VKYQAIGTPMIAREFATKNKAGDFCIADDTGIVFKLVNKYISQFEVVKLPVNYSGERKVGQKVILWGFKVKKAKKLKKAKVLA